MSCGRCTGSGGCSAGTDSSAGASGISGATASTDVAEGSAKYDVNTFSSSSIMVSRQPDAEIRTSVMRMTRREAIIGSCHAAARACLRLSSLFRLNVVSLKSRTSPSPKQTSAIYPAARSRSCVSGPNST